MEVLKFRLSGRCGMFSNNSINSYVPTYPHIHKVAVLGLLGSIIGIEKEKNNPTKFYKELKSLKIGIVPSKIKFNTNRSIYTNTTGYYNKNGSTYLCEYEELINPSWDIYVLNENENIHYSKIKDFILNKKSYFLPYLGRNMWFANIDDIEVLNGNYKDDIIGKTIDGIFLKNSNLELSTNNNSDRKYFEFIFPVGLDEKTGCYIRKNVAISNDYIAKSNGLNLFSVNNKLIYMF